MDFSPDSEDDQCYRAGKQRNATEAKDQPPADGPHTERYGTTTKLDIPWKRRKPAQSLH